MPDVKQCRLSTADGTTTVSWVPAELAVKGKAVTVDDDPTTYYITDVYHTPMDEAYLRKFRDDYRSQRRVSDV